MDRNNHEASVRMFSRNTEVMPELSVIIPCFNAEQTLGQQLEALSNQVCGRRWEVVLSNNGSTDDSIAVAERYRNRLGSQKKIPHLPNRG